MVQLVSRRISLELLGKTRADILASLLNGESTVSSLAASGKTIRPGVRKHLEYMQQLGIVESYFKQNGVGRPKKFYKITPLGRTLFPKIYDHILSELMSKLAKRDLAEGTNVVDGALEQIALDLATKFNSETNTMTFDKKLEALESFLIDLGFSCRVLKSKNGRVSIVRTDCALYNVAILNYPHVCMKFDTQLISRCLGGRDVELEQCMALGEPCCRHKLSP